MMAAVDEARSNLPVEEVAAERSSSVGVEVEEGIVDDRLNLDEAARALAVDSSNLMAMHNLTSSDYTSITGAPFVDQKGGGSVDDGSD